MLGSRLPRRWLPALVLLVCILFTFGAETLMVRASPKVQNHLPSLQSTPSGTSRVNNPRRRQRNTSMQNASGGVAASFDPNGLGSCDASVYDPTYGIQLGGFDPNIYVLGLAAGDNYGLEYSRNIVSFWLTTDNGGNIVLSPADLQATIAAGANLDQSILIGTFYNPLVDGSTWFAVGTCGDRYRDLGGQALHDLYYSYYDDPQTAPVALSALAETSIQEALESQVLVQPELIPIVPLVTTPPNTGYVEEGWLLGFDTPITNSVTTTDGDSFAFQGEAGQIVTATLVSSDFDSYLELWDVNGTVIASDDDSAGDLDSLLSFELPYSGLYYLAARSYDRTGMGAYTLTVSLSGGQPNNSVIVNPSAGSLDFSYVVWEEFELISGFTPDPYGMSVDGAGDGAISLAADPYNCSGYAQPYETIRLHYTTGSYGMMRIYFVAENGVDTVMIVNDPHGVWYCSDDSFGTLNPSLDFSPPSGGVYDIWIGSFGGEYVSGTLYVTEVDHHP
jgi:hypothetical protein